MTYNPYSVINFGSQDSPENWDIGILPPLEKSLRSGEYNESLLLGANDVEELLSEFSQYLDISKRVNSYNTKRSYIWNTKQFLLWLNAVEYSLERVKTTIELRNLAIVYNKVLDHSEIEQNTIALKMQSIRKFFEFFNSNTLSLDIRSAFNADWVTTQDTNAFKKQIRINEDVFDSICEYVNLSGTTSEKWILFFLAWGCRRSEIAGARVSDIDTINSCISIYQPKTGDTKKLPLPDWFGGIGEFSDNQVFIITNASNRCKKVKGIKPVTTTYIWHIVKKWLSETEYDGQMKISPHSFRRYFVNKMQKMGYSDSAIAKITGHKSVQMVARYGYDADLDNNPIVGDKAVKY